MKKVILALAIVSVTFAACNNGEDKKIEETTTIDTTDVLEIIRVFFTVIILPTVDNIVLDVL